MRKIRKIYALVVAGIFLCMILIPTVYADPGPPAELPYWSTEGNEAGKKDVLGTLNDQDLRIVTHGEQRMVITSDGNIGIGVLDPQYKLDVDGDAHISGQLFVDSGTGPSLEVTPIGVGIGTSTPEEALDVVGSVHASDEFIAGDTTTYGDGYISLSYGTNLDIDYGTLFIEGLNNRVGIGTQGPGAKLDVHVYSGGAATIGSSGNSATGYCTLALGHNSHATGWSSIAMGSSTTASGSASTAMGSNTNASGQASTAMGISTKASGQASTAMGISTKASGLASTAMGSSTTASGVHSTAMGAGTTASGGYSTAMGSRTTASGWCTTAMGYSITAQGDFSFGIGLAYESSPPEIIQPNTMAIMGGKVGIGTVAPTEALVVAGTINGEGLRIEGTVSGSGFNGWDTDFNNDLTTSTIFGGDLTGTYNNLQLIEESVGTNEIADSSVSVNKLAFDTATQAELDTHEADANAHHIRYADSEAISAIETVDLYVKNTGDTINGDLIVSGKLGIGMTSPNEKLTVEGALSLDEITAPSVTLGYGKLYVKSSDSKLYFKDDSGTEYDLTASGSGGMGGSGTINYIPKFTGTSTLGNSIIYETGGKLGIGTETPGARLDVHVSSGGAATIGNNGNSASGDYAIAMGRDATAIGTTSTAMGAWTTASGGVSTAMGSGTTASGSFSTAMGHSTKAGGYASTAMGYYTEAKGHYSTAMGREMIVSGPYSFGIGLDDPATAHTISLPNIMAIMGGNVGIGTVSPNYKLSIGDGTNERIHFSGSTSPSNPPSGSVVIYFDGTDLFAKNSSGTVITIADFP